MDQYKKPTINMPFLSKLPTDEASELLQAVDLSQIEKIEKYKLYSDFNYKRFAEYLRFKASQKLKHENDYQQQQDLIVNDTIVRKELSQMYGPMDEDHYDYSWILKKFKSNRIQQINEILQEFQDPNHNKDNYFDEKALISFSKNEINMFDHISKGPDYSKLEPFLLPRPKKVKSTLISSISSSNSDILFNVSQLIKKYPHGISLSQFIVQYRQSYDPSGKQFTPHVLGQAEKCSVIFTQMLQGHQIKILFPHSLKNYLARPEKILNKILHMFEVLLKLEFNGESEGLDDLGPSGSISELVSGLEDLMKDFPIRDFINDWGFTSLNQFAEILAANSLNSPASSSSNSPGNIQLVKAKPPSKKQVKRHIEVDEEHRFQYVPATLPAPVPTETETDSRVKAKSDHQKPGKSDHQNPGKSDQNPGKSDQKPGKSDPQKPGKIKTQELSSKSQSQPAVVQTKSTNQKQQQKKQQQQQQLDLPQQPPQGQEKEKDRKKKPGNKGRIFLAKDDDFPAL